MRAAAKACPWAASAPAKTLPDLRCFLASEEARYTTGSVLGADGGQAVGYFLSRAGAAVFRGADRLIRRRQGSRR